MTGSRQRSSVFSHEADGMRISVGVCCLQNADVKWCLAAGFSFQAADSATDTDTNTNTMGTYVAGSAHAVVAWNGSVGSFLARGSLRTLVSRSHRRVTCVSLRWLNTGKALGQICSTAPLHAVWKTLRLLLSPPAVGSCDRGGR